MTKDLYVSRHTHFFPSANCSFSTVSITKVPFNLLLRETESAAAPYSEVLHGFLVAVDDGYTTNNSRSNNGVTAGIAGYIDISRDAVSQMTPLTVTTRCRSRIQPLGEEFDHYGPNWDYLKPIDDLALVKFFREFGCAENYRARALEYYTASKKNLESIREKLKVPSLEEVYQQRCIKESQVQHDAEIGAALRRFLNKE